MEKADILENCCVSNRNVFLSISVAVLMFSSESRSWAAPRVCEMVSVNGEQVAVCPELSGGGGGHPNEKLIGFAQFLAEMEEALAESVSTSSAGARLDIGEPFNLQIVPTMQGTSEVQLDDGSGILAWGFANVAPNPYTGKVHLTLELTEGQVTRTLDQWLMLKYGVLSSWGNITITDGASSTMLPGGWSYSLGDGPMIDPDSEPGFEGELAAMLHAPQTPDRSIGLGTIFTTIGNVIGGLLHYIVDIVIPYTPPVSCSGLSIYDGSGQSCEGVNVPCKDNLSDACEMIDDIPGVSIAFKKCMKGRCGCSGSTFGRLRIHCDFAGDCGGCLPPPPGLDTFGCSLAGSEIWYCRDTDNRCQCVNTLFHEMSHGCGAPDGLFGMPGESDRIGNWFDQEFDVRFPNECAPALFGR